MTTTWRPSCNASRTSRTTQSKNDSQGDSVEVILGQAIRQEPQPLTSIQDEERSVVVRGRVLQMDVREMRSGRHLVLFDITDDADSISVKTFAEERDDWMRRISTGSWLSIRGAVQHDSYSQELTLLPKDICRIPPPQKRLDTAPEKRVELHINTKMSALDGVADVAILCSGRVRGDTRQYRPRCRTSFP